MDPTITAIVIGIVVAIVADLTTHGIRNSAKWVWRQITGKKVLATPDRKAEAIEAVKLNVASTNKRLRDTIEHVAKGNFTSPELRDALDEVRGEFLRHRSSWVVTGDTALLQRVEHWHDEVRRTKDDIANEERAWTQFMNTSPIHPQEIMILPAKRRLGEYQALLATGEVLETDVEALRLPSGPPPAPPSEAARARERLATRLLLVSGQCGILGHWLHQFANLRGIEDVLVDIERLSEGNSNPELDVIGDPELGILVIDYYRDVRRGVAVVRELAKNYKKHQALPNRDDLLQSSLTQAQAHAAQGERRGRDLAERVRQGT